MKRAVLSTLIGVGLLLFGFWTGRSSSAFYPSNTQLVDEMNMAVRQLAQTNEVNFLREMVRREMELRLPAIPRIDTADSLVVLQTDSLKSAPPISRSADTSLFP